MRDSCISSRIFLLSTNVDIVQLNIKFRDGSRILFYYIDDEFDDYFYFFHIMWTTITSHLDCHWSYLHFWDCWKFFFVGALNFIELIKWKKKFLRSCLQYARINPDKDLHFSSSDLIQTAKHMRFLDFIDGTT